MKIILLFLLIPFSSLAQNWTPISTQSFLELDEYRALYFQNENVGFIVRSGIQLNFPPVILKTTNGGQNWVLKKVGYDWNWFLDIKFVNDSVGYASSALLNNGKGILLRTTDRGENWVENICDSVGGMSVHFHDEVVGFMGGLGGIAQTTNGGVSWNYVYKKANVSIRRFHFINIAQGIAVGDSALYPFALRTINGGLTWQRVPIYGLSSRFLRDVHFISPQEGVIIGDSSILYQTTDGGQSWASVYPSAVPSGNLRGIKMISLQEWLLLGHTSQHNYIKKTTNSGQTWTNSYFEPITLNNTLRYFHFVNDSLGYALGDRGFLLRTTNGGGTITSISTKKSEAVSLGLQVYPNPITSESIIQYKLKEAGNIQLSVTDMLGKEVTVLAQAYQNAGNYELTWQPPSALQGMYLLVLQTAQGKQTKKIVVE